MNDNVTAFPHNSVNDIPLMLRALADKIAAGEQKAEAVYVVIPDPGRYPTIFGYGAYTSPEERVATMDMARYWILREQVQEIDNG